MDGTLNDLLSELAKNILNGTLFPTHYQRSDKWLLKTPYSTAANRYEICAPLFSVVINNVLYNLNTQPIVDLSIAANWDTVTPTDYTVAAARAGLNFYIYACSSASGLVVIVSANSTVPTGYTASNSRKIGQFHCLCLSVGTIAGHKLTGFVTGDVLPDSIQDLIHCPRTGMAPGITYDSGCQKWGFIYLASGTGVNTASVYGATISDTRDWMDFADDGAAIQMQMFRDASFQSFAAGSNEATNITGSADPVTAGGHVDTAGRRMISNCGAEDCCGALDQWLDEQSFRCDPDGTVVAAAQTSTIVHDDAPGGNPIYLRMGANGIYYLASNIATDAADAYIGPANYKVVIKHEAGAATGALGQVYFDDDAANVWEKLLCNIAAVGKNVFIPTNNPAFLLEIKHDASANTNGTALYYDDGADNRLESNNAGGVNATFDLSLNSQGWADYTLPGSKGKLYRQGTNGDVKLRAGRFWYSGTSCGSRGRAANNYRWSAATLVGCRFCAEPL